jgi:FKBP-type peptidyl-prolyl cis-trans isomerase SlyD
MIITSDKVVTLHYTLKDIKGEVLDSSEGETPLSYLHGAQNIVPGLEKALEGKTVGTSLQVVVSAEEGYGLRQEGLQESMALSNFEDPSEVKVGLEFEVEIEDNVEIATVVSIDGDTVLLDFNHPLAGEILCFDVSILDIRPATDEEKEHGHVHDEGGHEH